MNSTGNIINNVLRKGEKKQLKLSKIVYNGTEIKDPLGKAEAFNFLV